MKQFGTSAFNTLTR